MNNEINSKLQDLAEGPDCISKCVAREALDYDEPIDFFKDLFQH